MKLQWQYVKSNGTLGHQTEWTGDPSPEVDAVWEYWARMVCLSRFRMLLDSVPDIETLVKHASISEATFKKLHCADLKSARLTL